MIINLTQHSASAEQRAAGVVDMPASRLAALHATLTFDSCPSAAEIRDRAEFIAELACHNGLGADEGDDPLPQKAVIGGALWLMEPLAAELQARGIEPVFAFSVREVTERMLPDGSTEKTARFKHIAFIPAAAP